MKNPTTRIPNSSCTCCSCSVTKIIRSYNNMTNMTNIRYARAQCVCTLNTSGATLATQQEQEKVGVWGQHLDIWQEKKYEYQISPTPRLLTREEATNTSREFLPKKNPANLDFWQEKKYECQSKDLTFYEMSKSRHQMISICDTGGKDVHQHLHFWQEKNQI